MCYFVLKNRLFMKEDSVINFPLHFALNDPTEIDCSSARKTPIILLLWKIDVSSANFPVPSKCRNFPRQSIVNLISMVREIQCNSQLLY